MNSILVAALALVAFVEASPAQAFSENRYPVKETLDIVFAESPAAQQLRRFHWSCTPLKARVMASASPT